jgi:hypothetical protein
MPPSESVSGVVMENWDMVWPVGLLVVVVVLAIINAVQRAVVSSRELRRHVQAGT